MNVALLILSTIIALVTIPLSALVLMWAAKIFKVQNNNYITALKITGIIGIIGIFLDLIMSSLFTSITTVLAIIETLFLNIILAIVLIKKFYEIETKQTLLVWLVWFILSFILIVIIGTIVGIIVMALGFTDLIYTV